MIISINTRLGEKKEKEKGNTEKECVCVWEREEGESGKYLWRRKRVEGRNIDER